MALSLACALATAKGCDSAELGTFEDARLRVERLEEFKAWRASHAFPVAFSLGAMTTAQIRSECYRQVPVHADQPDRFELWHVFYVSSRRDEMLVMDLDGEPETLDAWRKASLR